MSRPVLALLIAAVAAPALAQTPGPTPDQIVAQQQAALNQFQAQLQVNQLQQLQRRNAAALQQPDPGVQAQAAVRQQQIQQQIDQTTALQQRMAAPDANPSDISSQLRQYDARIQRLQAPPIPTAP
jgi:hypothetical protein